MTLQTALVFQGRTRSRVLFLINSLFDAGSITYLGLWGLAQAFNWTITIVSSLYLGLAVVCYGGMAYFWTGVVPEKEAQWQDDVTKDENQDNDEKASVSPPLKEEALDDLVPSKPPHHSDRLTELDQTQTEHSTDDESSYILIADRTPLQQMLSGPFLMAVTYSTIMITINQWALTVTRDFLASLGDDEVNNKYLTIFTLLLPASLIAVPFTDEIVARYGFHGGFQTVNALGLGYSLVRLLSDNLDVQIIGFILFSFFRCFLFGVAFSVLPVLLSNNVVGKAMGVTFGIAGLTSYVNIPLSRLAIDTKGGDFFIPNLIYTIVILPSTLLSWCLANAANKEIRIREERKLKRIKEYSGTTMYHHM
jgi:hypothetical protein